MAFARNRRRTDEGMTGIGPDPEDGNGSSTDQCGYT